MTALAIIRAAPLTPCRPWPRHELSSDDWRAMAAALHAAPGLALLGLWADTVQVHALFHADAPLIASVPVEAGLYAALSPARPGAALFERAIADLWGHQAADAVDTRAWLDHGAWPLLRPLSERPAPNAGAPDVPDFKEAPGQLLPMGPLPPTLNGPAHWRAGMDGAVVQGLEARLGYAHRGLLGLMRGRTPAAAAPIAARIAGTATVAHSTAFARAVEAAAAATLPPRAEALRTMLLATERVAMALHDLHAGRPRETLLDACAAAFGHRLLMGTVEPGATQEPAADTLAALDAALAAAIPRHAPRGGEGQGVLPLGSALALAPGGVVGRASGRQDPLRPAAASATTATLATAGDVAARTTLRIAALNADIDIARHALATLPDGPVTTDLAIADAEGIGAADGPQGRVWHWVRVAAGSITACFPLDPAWLLLPAFEHAARGNALDALPEIAASCGLHPAGMEL